MGLNSHLNELQSFESLHDITHLDMSSKNIQVLFRVVISTVINMSYQFYKKYKKGEGVQPRELA